MRKIHLVGSLPFNSEQEAMEIAATRLGKNLLTMPDGEVGIIDEVFTRGRREAWIMTAIENMVDSGAFETVKNKVPDETGHPGDYKSLYRLKPKIQPKDIEEYLNFGYADYARQSYPIFKKIRKEKGLDGVKFQVGLPTGLAIALGCLSPKNALSFRRAFDVRLAREASEIISFTEGDVVFQIEVVFEVKLFKSLPGLLKKLPVSSVISLAKLLPQDIDYGIHLCLGDLKNQAFVPLNVRTVRLLVRFSNAITSRWPVKTHPLRFIHYPLAEGSVPPPVDPDLYRPLKNIDLPGGTRFIAGCVHEGLSEEDNRAVVSFIESARSGMVDIACSCGIGRRKRDVAEFLFDRSLALSQDQ